MKTNSQNLTGMVFDRLTVMSESVSRVHRRFAWHCLCKCGQTRIVAQGDLLNGHIHMCENCALQPIGYKHGLSYTKAWKIWSGMHSRCENPKDLSFKNYGGRGITVCSRWNEIENFVADMGQPPQGKTLERKDNNGAYSPENCVWATRLEQMNNTRRTVYVTWNGRTQSISKWARELGISYKTLQTRILKKWPLERAFSTKNFNTERGV